MRITEHTVRVSAPGGAPPCLADVLAVPLPPAVLALLSEPMVAILTRAWPMSTAALRPAFVPDCVVVVWDDGLAGLMPRAIARAECARIGAPPHIVRHLHSDNPDNLVVIVQGTAHMAALTLTRPGGVLTLTPEAA